MESSGFHHTKSAKPASPLPVNDGHGGNLPGKSLQARKSKEKMTAMDIQPFHIEVLQSDLDDLKHRLAQTRWPDEPVDAAWAYGTNRSYLQELLTYWQSQFDWRTVEKRLNRWKHYRTHINGLGIHFIHERAKESKSLPLLLTHGWPGTFWEMLKIIPLLTDPASNGGSPEDAFDVIIPSLPGYGFSDRPRGPGPWNVHTLWAELMSRLGYERFGAYGSDFGASVTTDLARSYPERVIGIHLTTASDIAWPSPLPDPSDVSEDEKDFLRRSEWWDQEEGGYRHEQRTRPQTLAYGLNDSPVGLAGWLVEKFRAWSDCQGEIERRFSKEELLTVVMLYWLTQTINSSMRDYYEHKHHPLAWHDAHFIRVPTAVALFLKDFPMPREWVQRSYNLQRWTEIASGGHFPAHEEPNVLAEEIRTFFRQFRSMSGKNLL
jgi:pimeloyl-ACP methyl ester carboxylesterase